MEDLPDVKFSDISDPIKRLEAILPFNRQLITVLIPKIEEAE